VHIIAGAVNVIETYDTRLIIGSLIGAGVVSLINGNSLSGNNWRAFFGGNKYVVYEKQRPRNRRLSKITIVCWTYSGGFICVMGNILKMWRHINRSF
jgi:hypothetical protein